MALLKRISRVLRHSLARSLGCFPTAHQFSYKVGRCCFSACRFVRMDTGKMSETGLVSGTLTPATKISLLHRMKILKWMFPTFTCFLLILVLILLYVRHHIRSSSDDVISLIEVSYHKQTFSNLTIKTNSGYVRGTLVNVDGGTVRAFLGIPFAEPPVGPLRYSKPLPVTKWKHVYNATQKRFPCLQPTLNAPHNASIDNANTTEDCLHLNIWTPMDCCDDSRCKKKAVILYIFGGALMYGGNSYDFYDGRYLSAYGDVIVVNMNYRLTVFGFLNAKLPDAPGNVGLHDQVLALHWIKDNIAHFGGDSNNIVLMGQSAGAISVGYLLLSPLTRGIVKRVIMQSGSPYVRYPDNTESALFNVQNLADLVKCPYETGTNTSVRETVECLRKKNATILIKKLVGKWYRFYPSLYDEVLPFSPVDACENGSLPKVDVLIGNTRKEGSMFLELLDYVQKGGENMSSREKIEQFYNIYIKDFSHVSALSVAWVYGLGLFRGTLSETAANIIGDYLFVCPVRYFAETMSQHTANKVYHYVFNYRSSFSIWSEKKYATHGDDVFFVFGYPFLYPFRATDAERELSRRMITMWSTFAKNSSLPNVGSRKWPNFKADDPSFVKIGLRNLSVMRNFRNKYCKFWESTLIPNRNKKKFRKNKRKKKNFTTRPV